MALNPNLASCMSGTAAAEHEGIADVLASTSLGEYRFILVRSVCSLHTEDVCPLDEGELGRLEILTFPSKSDKWLSMLRGDAPSFGEDRLPHDGELFRLSELPELQVIEMEWKSNRSAQMPLFEVCTLPNTFTIILLPYILKRANKIRQQLVLGIYIDCLWI